MEPEEKKVRQDPKTCKIEIGKEITIEFQKDKNQGIGFYIAGGSNTPCVSIIGLLKCKIMHTIDTSLKVKNINLIKIK